MGGNRDLRLPAERKLNTKCFFLKSRKEAASVEFLGGDREGWRGEGPAQGSWAWGWGWGQGWWKAGIGIWAV